MPAARCFCCGEAFQFGPYWYHGRYLPAYHLMLCTNCCHAIGNEWPVEHETRLLEWLKQHDLGVPERLANGRLPGEGVQGKQDAQALRKNTLGFLPWDWQPSD
jgi:hypothetical protein